MYDKAVQLIQNAGSPVEAFRQSGLDPSIIDKAQAKLDSGLAGTMLRALNADQKQVQSMLQQLKGMLSAHPAVKPLPSERVPDGRLSELKRTLEQVKRT